MVPLPPGPSGTYQCPDTHFQCPGDTYCVPVFVRCNDVYDCPGHEDELDCLGYSCPGLYQCRGSRVCLHAEHVCDGLYHCPHQDDELYCHVKCPHKCTCYGLAFVCPACFDASHSSRLRYLDASDSGITPRHVAHNVMLVYLSLARCGISSLNLVTFSNLHHIDLSENLLHEVTTKDLGLLPNLRHLILAGNPLASHIIRDNGSPAVFVHIFHLDISQITLQYFSVHTLAFVPNLKILNLSQDGIEQIEGSFQSLKELTVLDVRGCPLEDFQRNILKGLLNLKHLYAQNYKICCSSTLPADFNLNNCIAPFDEISSCQSLLQSDLYRVVLSVFAVFALTGNVSSIFIRLFVLERKRKSGFSVFVSHLCVSDFVMGVYLAIIGVADHMYRGTYLWEDVHWRHSVACKVAGFLSLLSSEVSASIICFITLDRFLALRFPLSGLHFSSKSSQLTCLLTWLLAVVIALIPLLPATAHWGFYSHTGICIPLPITRDDFLGRNYAFAIMIVLNFALFLLIALGQVFIYFSIRANSMTVGSDSTRKNQDVNIARRLITIAVSDFLCWFPIGLLGLLASLSVPVPGEVNVSMAVLVLPLNAALNPFLYNLNVVLERRRRAVEQQFLKALDSHLLQQEAELRAVSDRSNDG